VKLELLARGACDGRAEHENLKRLIGGQASIAGEEISLKEGTDIYSGSLQNPSEPDATYRKKAGKSIPVTFEKRKVANIAQALRLDFARFMELLLDTLRKRP
jgi:hypothetical protein